MIFSHHISLAVAVRHPRKGRVFTATRPGGLEQGGPVGQQRGLRPRLRNPRPDSTRLDSTRRESTRCADRGFRGFRGFIVDFVDFVAMAENHELWFLKMGVPPQ